MDVSMCAFSRLCLLLVVPVLSAGPWISDPGVPLPKHVCSRKVPPSFWDCDKNAPRLGNSSHYSLDVQDVIGAGASGLVVRCHAIAGPHTGQMLVVKLIRGKNMLREVRKWLLAGLLGGPNGVHRQAAKSRQIKERGGIRNAAITNIAIRGAPNVLHLLDIIHPRFSFSETHGHSLMRPLLSLGMVYETANVEKVDVQSLTYNNLRQLVRNICLTLHYAHAQGVQNTTDTFTSLGVELTMSLDWDHQH